MMRRRGFFSDFVICYWKNLTHFNLFTAFAQARFRRRSANILLELPFFAFQETLVTSDREEETLGTSDRGLGVGLVM